jgi:hypothetical protein
MRFSIDCFSYQPIRRVLKSIVPEHHVRIIAGAGSGLSAAAFLGQDDGSDEVIFDSTAKFTLRKV